MTFYKICFTAVVIGIGYSFFKRDGEWIGNLREEIDPLDESQELNKWNSSPPFNSAPPQPAHPPSLSFSWAAAFTSKGGILFYK